MKNEYIAPQLHILCFRPDAKIAALSDDDELFRGGKGDAASVADEDIDISI